MNQKTSTCKFRFLMLRQMSSFWVLIRAKLDVICIFHDGNHHHVAFSLLYGPDPALLEVAQNYDCANTSLEANTSFGMLIYVELA